jgi:hypothetical protein
MQDCVALARVVDSFSHRLLKIPCCIPRLTEPYAVAHLKYLIQPLSEFSDILGGCTIVKPSITGDAVRPLQMSPNQDGCQLCFSIRSPIM